MEVSRLISLVFPLLLGETLKLASKLSVWLANSTNSSFTYLKADLSPLWPSWHLYFPPFRPSCSYQK